MKRLIVNADDYGLSARVDDGILRAHESGIVTSTSVLACIPHAPSEIVRAKARCPELALGVHLCLTDLVPLSPANEIPTLLGSNGCFPHRSDFNRRIQTIDLGEVRLELGRQIDRFAASAGPPTHLDSHQFVTNWYPPLVTIMCELARAHGSIPVRWFPRFSRFLVANETLTSTEAQRYEADCAAVREELSPVSPGRFLHDFYGDRATEPTLLALLAELQSGVAELMCHPGEEDTSLADGYREPRPRELAILTAPTVREAVRTHGVQLVHYANAWSDE